MEGPDIITADESNFQLQVLEYSEYIPVVVDFWAKWCQECPRTSQQLEDLAVQHAGQFRLAQVNVDHNPGLVQRFSVHTVPSIKTFQNGRITSQLEGLRTDLQLKEYIQRIAPGPESLLLEKAATFLKDKQYLAVEDTCLEILTEQPDHPGAKLLLAKSLIWQGEYLEALTILNHFPASREFRSAEKLAPLVKALLTGEQQIGSDQPHQAVYRRALQLFQQDKLPAALDGLLEIVRSDKDALSGTPKDVILGILELLGEGHPLTGEYRQLLASALF